MQNNSNYRNAPMAAAPPPPAYAKVPPAAPRPKRAPSQGPTRGSQHHGHPPHGGRGAHGGGYNTGGAAHQGGYHAGGAAHQGGYHAGGAAHQGGYHAGGAAHQGGYHAGGAAHQGGYHAGGAAHQGGYNRGGAAAHHRGGAAHRGGRGGQHQAPVVAPPIDETVKKDDVFERAENFVANVTKGRKLRDLAMVFESDWLADGGVAGADTEQISYCEFVEALASNASKLMGLDQLPPTAQPAVAPGETCCIDKEKWKSWLVRGTTRKAFLHHPVKTLEHALKLYELALRVFPLDTHVLIPTLQEFLTAVPEAQLPAAAKPLYDSLNKEMAERRARDHQEAMGRTNQEALQEAAAAAGGRRKKKPRTADYNRLDPLVIKKFVTIFNNVEVRPQRAELYVEQKDLPSPHVAEFHASQVGYGKAPKGPLDWFREAKARDELVPVAVDRPIRSDQFLLHLGVQFAALREDFLNNLRGCVSDNMNMGGKGPNAASNRVKGYVVEGGSMKLVESEGLCFEFQRFGVPPPRPPAYGPQGGAGRPPPPKNKKEEIMGGSYVLVVPINQVAAIGGAFGRGGGNNNGGIRYQFDGAKPRLYSGVVVQPPKPRPGFGQAPESPKILISFQDPFMDECLADRPSRLFWMLESKMYFLPYDVVLSRMKSIGTQLLSYEDAAARRQEEAQNQQQDQQRARLGLLGLVAPRPAVAVAAPLKYPECAPSRAMITALCEGRTEKPKYLVDFNAKNSKLSLKDIIACQPDPTPAAAVPTSWPQVGVFDDWKPVVRKYSYEAEDELREEHNRRGREEFGPELWEKNPRKQTTHLVDDTQLESLMHIFKHNVAVVQGSAKFVQLLLQNYRDLQCGPILTLCFTNHALDAFLTDILDFEEASERGRGGELSRLGIVRLGNVKKDKVTPPPQFQQHRGRNAAGARDDDDGDDRMSKISFVERRKLVEKTSMGKQFWFTKEEVRKQYEDVLQTMKNIRSLGSVFHTTQPFDSTAPVTYTLGKNLKQDEYDQFLNLGRILETGLPSLQRLWKAVCEEKALVNRRFEVQRSKMMHSIQGLERQILGHCAVFTHLGPWPQQEGQIVQHWRKLLLGASPGVVKFVSTVLGPTDATIRDVEASLRCFPQMDGSDPARIEESICLPSNVPTLLTLLETTLTAAKKHILTRQNHFEAQGKDYAATLEVHGATINRTQGVYDRNQLRFQKFANDEAALDLKLQTVSNKLKLLDDGFLAAQRRHLELQRQSQQKQTKKDKKKEKKKQKEQQQQDERAEAVPAGNAADPSTGDAAPGDGAADGVPVQPAAGDVVLPPDQTLAGSAAAAPPPPPAPALVVLEPLVMSPEMVAERQSLLDEIEHVQQQLRELRRDYDIVQGIDADNTKEWEAANQEWANVQALVQAMQQQYVNEVQSTLQTFNTCWSNMKKFRDSLEDVKLVARLYVQLKEIDEQRKAAHSVSAPLILLTGRQRGVPIAYVDPTFETQMTRLGTKYAAVTKRPNNANELTGEDLGVVDDSDNDNDDPDDDAQQMINAAERGRRELDDDDEGDDVESVDIGGGGRLRWHNEEQRKYWKQYVQDQLSGKTDLSQVPDSVREAFALIVVYESRFALVDQLNTYIQALESSKAKLDAMNIQSNYEFLSESARAPKVRLIGSTTTAVMKYMASLQKMKIKIIIVEEAAEVLESHVLAALSQHVEHLILIGDHRQLMPKVEVEQLIGMRKNLSVSLMERLASIPRFPFTTLSTQRRMHPELSTLTSPIYLRDSEPGDRPVVVKDHPSTLKREPCKGVMKDARIVFVDTHGVGKGEQEDPHMKSAFNEQEAETALIIAKYLGGLEHSAPHKVTLLVPYTGQFFCVRRKAETMGVRLSMVERPGCIRVATIDNFQGEENDFIVLTLVRTTTPGFLRAENRACVALSRARRGMFVVGDAELWEHDDRIEHDLWARFIELCRAQGTLLPYFPAVCPNHYKPEADVAVDEIDNDAALQGEGDAAETGGVATEEVGAWGAPSHGAGKRKKVTVGDLSFLNWTDYQRKINSNGGCRNVRCNYAMRCGHRCVADCHPQEGVQHLPENCELPCMRLSMLCNPPRGQDCDHPCTKKCKEPCGPCEAKVKMQCPTCDYTLDVTCDIRNRVRNTKSEMDVAKLLKCSRKVTKRVTDEGSCGHEFSAPCHEWATLTSLELAARYCRSECKYQMPCGHQCSKTCNKCSERALKTVRSQFPTSAIMTAAAAGKAASHQEVMENCELDTSVVMPCGHSVTLKCRDVAAHRDSGFTRVTCEAPCRLADPRCGHPCTLPRCHYASDPTGHVCDEKVTKVMPHCRHQVTDAPCNPARFQAYRCTMPCGEQLPKCQHACKGTCGTCHFIIPRLADEGAFDDADWADWGDAGRADLVLSSHVACQEDIDVRVDRCGHDARVKCGERTLGAKCSATSCEWACEHRDCRQSNPVHTCANHYDHGQSLACQMECGWRCEHQRCELRCHEPCTRPPCLLRCPNTLPCGHRCHGVCGEMCPEFCLDCLRSHASKQPPEVQSDPDRLERCMKVAYPPFCRLVNFFTIVSDVVELLSESAPTFTEVNVAEDDGGAVVGTTKGPQKEQRVVEGDDDDDDDDDDDNPNDDEDVEDGEDGVPSMQSQMARVQFPEFLFTQLACGHTFFAQEFFEKVKSVVLSSDPSTQITPIGCPAAGCTHRVFAHHVRFASWLLKTREVDLRKGAEMMLNMEDRTKLGAKSVLMESQKQCTKLVKQLSQVVKRGEKGEYRIRTGVQRSLKDDDKGGAAVLGVDRQDENDATAESALLQEALMDLERRLLSEPLPPEPKPNKQNRGKKKNVVTNQGEIDAFEAKAASERKRQEDATKLFYATVNGLFSRTDAASRSSMLSVVSEVMTVLLRRMDKDSGLHVGDANPRGLAPSERLATLRWTPGLLDCYARTVQNVGLLVSLIVSVRRLQYEFPDALKEDRYSSMVKRWLITSESSSSPWSSVAKLARFISAGLTCLVPPELNNVTGGGDGAETPVPRGEGAASAGPPLRTPVRRGDIDDESTILEDWKDPSKRRALQERFEAVHRALLTTRVMLHTQRVCLAMKFVVPGAAATVAPQPGAPSYDDYKARLHKLQQQIRDFMMIFRSRSDISMREVDAVFDSEDDLERFEAKLREEEKRLSMTSPKPTREEMQQVLRALGAEGGAGHIYKCSKGHLYVIADCGGAMMTSTCPECGETVGGAQHQAVRTSQFAGADVYGAAARPAWPQAGGFGF